MNDVDEIKQRLEVADVVGSYVPLKQAGRNLKAPCPFHHEKTASFMVSPEKGIWHCFGCGEGGDIFKFIMKIEGVDFRGALEQLAKRAGVQLSNAPRDTGQAKLRTRLLEAHAWAVKYFQACLVKNPTAIAYVVQKRKLTKQTIRDFGIGYAPESWDGLVGTLRGKGFSDEELVKGGLAGRKSAERGAYDLFRGRIMFTIADASGEPIGFTGRVLGDEQPKYLNTPQTPLYDKGRVLYGLHLAKEAIRKSDQAVLVEGNMDVVASHQAGVRQVVAASGTALTLEQLKALSYLTKNIYLAFDTDKAGLAATERAVPLAQKLGLTLYIVDLRSVDAEAKDADELIAKDPKLWQKAIKQAKELRQYWLERSLAEFEIKQSPTGIQKVRFVERMAAILRLYDDMSQAVFVSDIAAATDIDPETITKAIEHAPSQATPPTNRPAVQPSTTKRAPVAGRTMLEETVLALNLAYPEARLSLDDLTPGDFENEQLSRIAAHLKQIGKDKTALEVASDLPELADYVKILALRGEEHYDSFAPADRSFEAFTLTRRLQTLSQKLTKHQLTQALQAAERAGDAAKVRELLSQYQALISED